MTAYNKRKSIKQRIETQTAGLYGDLFSRNTDAEFFHKAQSYIGRINIDRDWFCGKICLDAGCGVGAASYSFATVNKTKVIGFDLSQLCLNVALKRLKVLNNFFPVQASVEAVPFKDNSFDFINCNGVLHHICDVDMALSEFFRILKPGGLLFTGVYGRGGLMNEHKIKFYRFLVNLFSYALLRKLLWVKNKNELLDNLCVPIRRSFSEKEMRTKLLNYGFSETIRVAEDFYRKPSNCWEKLIMGPDGMYLHFLTKKEKL